MLTVDSSIVDRVPVLAGFRELVVHVFCVFNFLCQMFTLFMSISLVSHLASVYKDLHFVVVGHTQPFWEPFISC